MSTEGKVSLTISVSKEYRDKLRTLAARQNLVDPDNLTSASTLAREIICEHINKLKCLEDGVKDINDDVDPPK